MGKRLLQLFPQPGGEVEVEGLYLSHRVHEIGAPGHPFVYGNFVASLDGRIALQDDDGQSHVPKALTTAEDWSLFRELHAQADCYITHGGYLRALAAGRLDDILQVGVRTDDTHLLEWRKNNGLTKQPGIVAASASLDFPLPPSIIEHDQKLIIATGEQADRDRIKAWRARGCEILLAGKGRLVEAAPLVQALAKRGFRCIYLLAGPQMLESMLMDAQLVRMYLTLNHRLLGGDAFHTLLAGRKLGDAGLLTLRSLYYAPPSDANTGQFFARFDPPNSNIF